MMLLSDWYFARQEKRLKAAVDAAKAEGVTEGEARPYRAIVEWDRRRKEAEARSETFTESRPRPRQSDSE